MFDDRFTSGMDSYVARDDANRNNGRKRAKIVAG